MSSSRGYALVLDFGKSSYVRTGPRTPAHSMCDGASRLWICSDPIVWEMGKEAEKDTSYRRDLHRIITKLQIVFPVRSTSQGHGDPHAVSLHGCLC